MKYVTQVLSLYYMKNFPMITTQNTFQ